MPSALELTEGQVFAGQFRVVKPLAQGGMGAVYVVEQLSTGKKRALKLMLPSAAVVDGSRRFEQEARTSSLIPSEHVVDVIAAGVEGPDCIPWLAMELLEGESLEDYLEQNGALSPNQAYEILSQLAHALSAAHDLGVVHRDLKPENIFLARSRTSSSEFMVKVLDFGLATVIDPTSKNTTALGSPLWMAPEQTQKDEPISLSTDIWSVGLIVFRMLSGRYYWQSIEGSLVRLMREIVLDPLPAASERSRQADGAELPAGFDEWFGQCVVRFAAYRFGHAREAWQELHTVLVNAGATPQAPRSLSQRPRTDAPRTAPPPPTENISGNTELSASKTLVSQSDADLARASVAPPPNVAVVGVGVGVAMGSSAPTMSRPPENATGRSLVFFLVLIVTLGAGAAYWMRQRKQPAASAAADGPALTVPALSSARLATPPAVTPLSPTPSAGASANLPNSAAPLLSSAPAPLPSASSTKLAHPAAKITPKPAPHEKPAQLESKPDKPAATLPDLL